MVCKVGLGGAFPGMRIINAGTVGQTALEGPDTKMEELKPTIEIWTKYRLPWLKPLDGLKQFEGWPES